MTPFLVVVAVGLGSYVFRVSMLVLAARTGIPPWIEGAARYAVPVSFAALAAAALVPHAGAHRTSIAPVAGVAAAVVAVRRTGSPRAALVVGMPVVWIVSALLGA